MTRLLLSSATTLKVHRFIWPIWQGHYTHKDGNYSSKVENKVQIKVPVSKDLSIRPLIINTNLNPLLVQYINLFLPQLDNTKEQKNNNISRAGLHTIIMKKKFKKCIIKSGC